ncbi:MAG: sigma-70 family RNA polymerase sigma factor, partial [Planctomycetota bacterium]
MDPSLRLDDLTRHTQGLARLAGAILGDPDGGEDVAQEAVIRALRADRRPSRTEELRPWLRTITRRLALNERAARRSRTDRERARSGADVAPSTDEIVARAETAERLHAVVRGLSPAHSAGQHDRYGGGRTPTRGAERDGVS